MSRVHLMDLVRRHDASDANWAYVEDPAHVTRGVMCWRVTLFHALIPTEGGYGQYRVAAHTIKLANGAELVTDEYVAHRVLKRLEQAS
jgi:hypothetical protein